MKLRSTVRILAIALALFGAGDLSAQERVVVNVDNVKIAQAPSFDSPGTPVLRGAVLTVLERNGDWIRVFDGATMGFIHSAFVAGGTAPSAAVPPQAFPQQPYPQAVPPQQPYPGQYAAQPTGVRTPGTPGYKDPNTARIFSAVIIGGGQFYSGQTGKGIFLAGLGYGSLFVAPMLIANAVVEDADDCFSYDPNDPYYYEDCLDTAEAAPALAYGAWAIGLGTWIYGIVSADDAANAANAQPYYGLSPVIESRGNRTYAGLQLKF